MRRRNSVPAMASIAEVLGLRLWNMCDDKRNKPSAATMKSLIAGGANVNTQNKIKWTVLMRAAYNDHLEAVKILLAVESIDICIKCNWRITAFMFSCSNGNVEIVKALLEAHKKTPDFDINDASIHGTTGLIKSCEKSNVELVKLLLSDPRINPQLRDNKGKTALEYAKGTANEGEIRALLQGELLSSLPFSCR
jgi:ankyrin repeat protein